VFHTDSRKFSHALSVPNVSLADRCALSLALPLHIGHSALVKDGVSSVTLAPERITLRAGVAPRLALAVTFCVWSVWEIVDLIAKNFSLLGTIIWIAILCFGDVLMTRFVLIRIVLSEDRLVVRGLFRTRTVRRNEVSAIETRPFQASVLATLRLRSGGDFKLPLAAQGNRRQMAEFVQRLETWRRASWNDPAP